MLRFLLIVSLALQITGCSRIQFAYNQLDWLIPYYVEKYVELSDSQDTYLQQRVDNLLLWHCSAHLSAYADLLRTANSSFQDGTMSEEKLQHFLNQINGYWMEIKQQASPSIAHLLFTSNDTQIDEFINSLTKSNTEWLERFKAQTDEELRLDYQQNMTDELERWFGPLLASQQKAVYDWSRRFKPLGIEGLNTRRRWLSTLQDLLSHRDDLTVFNRGIEQLFVNPEAIRSSKYLDRIEHNKQITTEMIVFVGKQLNDEQRDHLASMIGSVSRDFDKLACTGERPDRQLTWKKQDTPAFGTSFP